MHRILTILYKTQNALNNSLFSTPPLAFWSDILAHTFQSLSTRPQRPPRIVVYSTDDFCEADELVTALLDDPLSSDQKTAAESCILHQFSVPLQITQLHASKIPTKPPPLFFKAEIPIVVFNPLVTPLSSLRHPLFPSHALFVTPIAPHLNYSPSSVSQILPNSSSPHILFIDPSRALSAVQSFRSNPSSPVAIQQYQDNYNQSGLPHLTNAIRSIVDSEHATPSPSAYLRNRTAVFQLYDALNAFNLSIDTLQINLDDIREGVSQLTRKIEEAKARIPLEIFFGQSAQAGGKDIVDASLKLASKEMKLFLKRLSWWKTVLRTDEISGIVGDAVERVWCQDLEQKLILQTGRLVSLQKELETSASLLVNNASSSSSSSGPHPPLPANILKNALSQLTSSPNYSLSPSTLISPITQRKHQLFTYPTTRLHLKAQRLVLTMSSAVAVSSGFTWAGWMGHLAQNVLHDPSTVGGTIWSTVGMGMDPMTGIGVGLLGLIASLRWAVAKWEKEKKRWWTDWERIGTGLERDLKVSVDRTMKDQVVVVADAACKGLAELCEKRQNEVDKVKNEVVELQNQLRGITSRTVHLMDQ